MYFEQLMTHVLIKSVNAWSFYIDLDIGQPSSVMMGNSCPNIQQFCDPM